MRVEVIFSSSLSLAGYTAAAAIFSGELKVGFFSCNFSCCSSFFNFTTFSLAPFPFSVWPTTKGTFSGGGECFSGEGKVVLKVEESFFRFSS